MKSYSESDIFHERERLLMIEASRLVAKLDEHEALRHAEKLRGRPADMPRLRCHELARAVGKILDLPTQDGKYGTVEHSWLWTGPVPQDFAARIAKHGHRNIAPNILDVYAVGQLPQVQLIDVQHVGLTHRTTYVSGLEREDVDEHVVAAITRQLR
jgi:hypothetical protein